MSFSVEYSGLAITHLIYEAALVLILAMVRWIFSSAICFRYLRFRSSNSDAEREHLQSPRPCTVSTMSKASDDQLGQMMVLHAATYGDIAARVPESCSTCAVCLDELRKRDKVRELRNCCHVFHQRCIDRWLNHDDPHRSTCPVCRTPILRSSAALTMAEPSWAVERLLYIFGDDLHPLL
ncbi:hypothetical protein NE237_029494 [Protea cynaroides]|uniref:RING-type domain-containing protein n=1 Tax=Protea cynaroides TaxID=273540 RepID=A0A9Q0GVD6_9MAGN|nr:hypothetical protein NE237_029494 [Protea cynaroides]